MSDDSTVELLRGLGMTEWEAKTYLALLRRSPVTGYAAAAAAGVPRAKIYEVLKSLVASNVVRIARSEPTQYTPVPPDELLSRLSQDHAQRVEAAEEALAGYGTVADDGGEIWDIQGRDRILDRARSLLAAAASRVLVEIWEPDVEALRPDIEDAIRRGVSVVAVCYGDVSLPDAEVHTHPSTDAVTAGLGGRWLVLSVDDRHIVAGLVSGGPLSRAASTSHPALVVPITELVTHDLYKLVVLSSHPELEEEFGPGLSKLRARFAYSDRGGVPQNAGSTP